MQVGRSGVVTPVAIVEPVDIEGVTVERSTLHNFDEIERKDIRIGDKVIILRSGDVIPKIIKVIASERNGSEQIIHRPKHCPVCHSELLDEGALIKCQNMGCEARIIGSLRYFASKGCMNIDGLGSKIIEQLFQEGKIKSIIDLYSLKYDDLIGLEGFQDKSINNLLQSIENTKHVESWRFIRALGIEHIGEVASKTICQDLGIENLEIPKEILMGLNEFGEEMANSYANFMHINHQFVQNMKQIIEPIISTPTHKINELNVIKALFKAKDIGDKSLENILKFFSFYSIKCITAEDVSLKLNNKKINIFNSVFIQQESKYKELLQHPVIKTKRLEEAIENGEILTVQYNGGSQLNKLRTIQPRNIKNGILYAYHGDKSKSFFIEKLTIHNCDDVIDADWYDENINDVAKKVYQETDENKYVIPDLKNIDLDFIVKFADKSNMGIDELGKHTIQKLYDKNVIHDIESLYNLTIERIQQIEGFEGLKGKTIVTNIQESKNCECWRFICALQIPLFGAQSSKLICNNYGIDFVDLTFNKLVSIEGLGEDRANTFKQYMYKNKEVIESLKKLISPIATMRKEIKNNFFQNKTIVLTGTMSQSRDEIKTLLESMGAKISGSVSQKTDYVIYGEDAGSKYNNALKLGVTLLTESEFREKMDPRIKSEDDGDRHSREGGNPAQDLPSFSDSGSVTQGASVKVKNSFFD